MAVSIHKGGTKKHAVKIKSPKKNGGTNDIELAVGEIVETAKDGSMKEEVVVVGAVHGPGPFANVGGRVSRTFNLGNFNSLKIEISLHVPSVNTVEEINENHEFCVGWLDQKMDELTSKVQADNPDAVAE